MTAIKVDLTSQFIRNFNILKMHLPVSKIEPAFFNKVLEQFYSHTKTPFIAISMPQFEDKAMRF